MASLSQQRPTPNSSIGENAYSLKNTFPNLEFRTVSQELALWHEKKRSVHNNLNNMLHQQSKENWGVFARRLSSFPTSLEMIIYSLQSELELINKHISELEQKNQQPVTPRLP